MVITSKTAQADSLLDRQGRFRALVDSHREGAVRLAFRLVGGDAAAAEDVAQDAFVRAYRALPRFREEASLKTWFYRILVREAERHRRWKAVRELWADRSGHEVRVAEQETPGDPWIRRRIAGALDRLTARQRAAFVLIHLEGFSVTETAAVLGRSPGTIKSHLHRALESLRSELADLREQEADHGGFPEAAEVEA